MTRLLQLGHFVSISTFLGESVPMSNRRPFIKGADGKIGWDVIRAEGEQAQEGSTINVDINGSTVVPGGHLISPLLSFP